MKIQIRGSGHNLTIPLPTGMIFGKGTLWLVNRFGRKYAPDALANIPPEAMEVLFSEFRRIRQKYGHWVLVDMESADGAYIKITL